MKLADKTPFENGMTVYMARYKAGKPCEVVAYHDVVIHDDVRLKSGFYHLWDFECYATSEAARLAWFKSFKKDLSRNKKRLISLKQEAANLEQWINENSPKF